MKQKKVGAGSFIKIIKEWSTSCNHAGSIMFTFNMILGDMLNVQYIAHYLGQPKLSSILIAPVSAGLIFRTLLVPKFQKFWLEEAYKTILLVSLLYSSTSCLCFAGTISYFIMGSLYVCLKYICRGFADSYYYAVLR
jgi:hypothetical protein